jgi:hypothetical protein
MNQTARGRGVFTIERKYWWKNKAHLKRKYANISAECHISSHKITYMFIEPELTFLYLTRLEIGSDKNWKNYDPNKCNGKMLPI